MASWLEHCAARLAAWHAARVQAAFLRSVQDTRAAQGAALARALKVVRGSDFARRLSLDRVRAPDELRRAVPLQRYDDLAPHVERLAAGEPQALLARGRRLLMLATTSGTTARQKLIPVTDAFAQDYRRGWNVFGLKMLSDHPDAILRAILQSSGRFDERRTPGGTPIGAITGLLARLQKPIVRRFYVGRPEIAEIPEPRGRYYALARLGVERDVAFAVTANPATLIRIAQTADEESERLIGDVHDGTISRELVSAGSVRSALAARLRPNPDLARRLERLRIEHGALRPRDYWRLSFLACWIGGSMGHYRERLAAWYGPLPVRDLGLLASEGRVTIPMEDDRPAGVLDVTAAFFEFIPVERFDEPQPETLLATELIVGRDYAVVLSNAAGLLRYRLDDVVRVVGRVGDAPVLEFLYRGGRVASLAGEKLSENQVVEAVTMVRQQFRLPPFDFVVAPRWTDPPGYVLCSDAELPAGFEEAADGAISRFNSEYADRRRSGRLMALGAVRLDPGTIEKMDNALTSGRSSMAEQYKRPVLFCDVREYEAATGR
ncbi:MAG TPA: GH3 auxin-responsive promoter family protein [Phycisphaerae bacterium]|nr:GH3 auxin-responsive promoter family protein [Phycisphaerae bacterium]